MSGSKNILRIILKWVSDLKSYLESICRVFVSSYYSITVIESKLDCDQTDIFKFVSHQMIEIILFLYLVFFNKLWHIGSNISQENRYQLFLFETADGIPSAL